MQHRKYSANHPNSIQHGKKHPQQNKAEKSTHEIFVVLKISINFQLYMATKTPFRGKLLYGKYNKQQLEHVTVVQSMIVPRITGHGHNECFLISSALLVVPSLEVLGPRFTTAIRRPT